MADAATITGSGDAADQIAPDGSDGVPEEVLSEDLPASPPGPVRPLRPLASGAGIVFAVLDCDESVAYAREIDEYSTVLQVVGSTGVAPEPVLVTSAMDTEAAFVKAGEGASLEATYQVMATVVAASCRQLMSEVVITGGTLLIAQAGSRGTSAAAIAPAIAQAVAGQVFDIAAELELGAAISMTAAVITDAVDVAGGGVALSEAGIEGESQEKPAVGTKGVPVETAEEVAPHIDAVVEALAAEAGQAGVAAISLYIDITNADGRIASSRVLVFWEGEECTAIRQAQRQIFMGRATTTASNPKRYMLTQLRQGMPCCVSIVYFGTSSRVALEQLEAAKVARKFRSKEAARGALWTNLVAANEDLTREIEELKRAAAKRDAAAGRVPEGSAGYVYPTACSTARAASRESSRGRGPSVGATGAGTPARGRSGAPAFGSTTPRTLSKTASRV